MTKHGGWPPKLELVEVASDWDEVSPTVAIVELAGRILDRPQTSFTPLNEVVDPGALDRVLATGERRDIDLTLTYESLTVHASSDGSVAVAGPRTRSTD